MMYEQQHRNMREMELMMRKQEEERRKCTEEERLEIVDLSGLSLDFLPNPSINLTAICKLDVSNNNLQSIPESLTARLLNVVALDVHSNQLQSLPNSIGCLSKLKILNAAGNLLTFLPKSIENCRIRSLEELNANFNKLRRLPDNIGFELVKLKKLSVNSNNLAFLPHSITQLTSLTTLDARLNNIRSLPEDLDNLIKLQVLNVSQNFQYLVNLPYSIGFLISLVELDVSYNKIRSLPESIGCLRRLHKLRVEGNPLVSPPVEVVEQGLHTVKEYLCEKKNGNQQSQSQSQRQAKKKSWVGKLVKYGTFNGIIPQEIREGFINVSDYHRSIDGLASPRHMGKFSPRRRRFTPRNLFS